MEILGIVVLGIILFRIASAEVNPQFNLLDRKRVDQNIELHSLFGEHIVWKSEEVNVEDFITKFEGFRKCAYKDLGGGYSIGYGTRARSATECITERTARLRLREKVLWVKDMLHLKFPKLNHNQLVVLTDVVFNVRPKNLGYIYKQVAIDHPVRQEKELTYALYQMSCSRQTPTSPCIHHTGLLKRYNERIKLFFNK